jgi:outer membrane biosynthesis protein TonB
VVKGDVMTKTDLKVLRIGLVKDGKVVQERLLEKPSSVTIGTSDKCTFQLAVDGLPPVYPLIKVKQREYTLQFTTKMAGKLMVGDTPDTMKTLDFKSIAERGISRQEGKLHVIKMTSKTRGKIQIGEFTLLFQFISLQPTQTRPPLPKAYRRFTLKSIDWAFCNILLMSCLLQTGSFTYLINRDVQFTEGDIRDAAELYMEILNEEKKIPPKIEEPEEPVKERDEKSEEKSAKLEKVPDPTPQNKTERVKILKRNVAKKTILKYLVSGNGGTSIVGELSGGVSQASIDGAFENATIAFSGGNNRRKKGLIGPSEGKVTTIDDRDIGAGSGRAAVRSVKKRERKIKSKIKVRSPDEVVGTGQLSPAKIQRVVRRNSRRLQGCYESGLKKDPTLQGVVKVRFTIETTGRVSKSRTIQNTMRSKSVAKCIENNIKKWRFRNKPKGGSVTIAYPFYFTPSS